MVYSSSQHIRFFSVRIITVCADADDSICNNDGLTPLEVAAARGHTEVVRVLQHPGVDLGSSQDAGNECRKILCMLVGSRVIKAAGTVAHIV
jgi:ankyrin repeat protein